jgi:hypothetical protein
MRKNCNYFSEKAIITKYFRSKVINYELLIT